MSNAPVNEQLEELLELDQWLSATRAGAEELLPDLLGLTPSQLGLEIERHPELRLAIMWLLLSVADRMREENPVHAHALTGVVVEHAGVLVPPLGPCRSGGALVDGTDAIVRTFGRARGAHTPARCASSAAMPRRATPSASPSTSTGRTW